MCREGRGAVKAIVLGGGVIGVCTAYYLAKAGHEVAVIERQPEAGCETTFANGGLIAVGHAATWAEPSAPLMLLKSLWQADSAIRFRPSLDPALWAWGLRFLANCTAQRYRVNTLRNLRLSKYSHEVMAALREETQIPYDEATKGILYVYRDPARLEHSAKAWALVRDHGVAVEVKSAAESVRIEPALAPARDKFVGAIYSPSDESGDACMFTRHLAKLCEGLGVRFNYGASISGLKANAEAVESVVTDKGEFVADNYVLAAGSYSPSIARSIGVRLPIYPIKGYSVTVPIGGRQGAPTVGVIDESTRVAFVRLGERLRLAGIAEFSGYDTSYKPRDFGTMFKAAKELFPDGGDYDRPEFWACLRPMTPDGPPIMGRGRHRNLYFNIGHGHLGWTMGCGAGRVIADLIAGRRPGIDLDGLTIDRF